MFVQSLGYPKKIFVPKNCPLLGIGQGNGGGPAMWISHLTVMFTAILLVCDGFVTTCIHSSNQLYTVGTGYIDNFTLGLLLPVTMEESERTVKIT